jgi:hypothetical protein
MQFMRLGQKPGAGGDILHLGKHGHRSTPPPPHRNVTYNQTADLVKSWEREAHAGSDEQGAKFPPGSKPVTGASSEKFAASLLPISQRASADHD